jgi:hypothetical protein
MCAIPSAPAPPCPTSLPLPTLQTQLTLDSFLTKSERFAKIKSKRLQQVGSAGGRSGRASVAGIGPQPTVQRP